MYKLIIADDEERIRTGLKKFMNWASLGFVCVADFEDGAEVIEYLRHHEVDVVLTDIRMAQISGIEIAKYVHERHPRIKVVINSGYAQFEYAKRAIEYKVEHYLIKPTNIDETRQVFLNIRDALGRERQQSDQRTALALRQPELQALTDVKAQPANPLAGSADGAGAGQASYILVTAQAYMNANYHKDISLEDVAKSAFVSPAYFSRLYKQQTGETFIEALTRLRMNKAVELLKQRKHKMYEISERVGYKSSKYFNRQFKQSLGCTPKEYVRIALKAGDTADE